MIFKFYTPTLREFHAYGISKTTYIEYLQLFRV